MNEVNKVDLGSIKIHKAVLSEITYTAVTEMQGVSLVTKDITSMLGDVLGIKQFPGITINVDRNNQVTIDVKIIVAYGLNIPDIARQTQDTVRQAIEKTVDIDLKDVNVNIQGIERRKE